MRRLVLFLFSLLLLQQTYSQAGTLDPTYGNGGISADFPRQMKAESFAVGPDGKTVLGGAIPDPDQYRIAVISRLTANGALDKTFSGDGILVEHDINVALFGLDVAVQKDGKVLAAGVETGTGAEGEMQQQIIVIRYNKDGTRDITFGAGGKAAASSGSVAIGSAPELVVLSDGKIVMVTEDRYPDVTSGMVTIFNPNGTTSDSYNTPVMNDPDNPHIYLAAYPEGGGYALSYAVDPETVAIYSTRFGTKTFAAENANYYNRLTILKNGKVAFLSPLADKTVITVLKTDGTKDSSFSGDGIRHLTDIRSGNIISDAKGRIIVEGNRIGYGLGFLRLNVNGSTDTGFGDNGFVRSDYTLGVAVYGNRLFVAGERNIAAYLLYTDPRYVKVNLFAGSDPIASSEWNNWNNLRSLHYNNFYYSDSTISSIDAVLSARNGVNDNGSSYVGGMAPPRVLRHSSQNTGTRTLTLSGLTVSKRYSIELYASRNANSGDTTVFTVDGVSKKIGTYRNNTNKATFANLAPNAQGQIVVTISSTKTYNYLNGFTLTESFASTVPAMDNSITIQKKGETIVEGGDLQVSAYPNPAPKAFTLQLRSSNAQPLQVRVLDMAGRVVEAKQNIAANTSLSLGSGYRAGVYYVEIIARNPTQPDKTGEAKLKGPTFTLRRYVAVPPFLLVLRSY
jgi:uncharacterized delta-60 repeat protein